MQIMSCCQKVPSAKRCIKTWGQRDPWPQYPSQKAPSAKRCIKTLKTPPPRLPNAVFQKAPSGKRCIKTRAGMLPHANLRQSESTERQKVH